ncbi:MAG: hypothetical protein ACLFVQ_08775 [Chitinispirillaceae bacterium]
MINIHRTIAIAVLFTVAHIHADPSTRTVQAEFSRCESAMKRVEREIERYEKLVAGLRDVLRTRRQDAKCNPLEISGLHSRVEYFRSRLERTRSQADKIRSDIKSVEGPTCPSCVSSSVDLYCRHYEHLSEAVTEYYSKASDIRNRMRQSRESGTAEPDSSHVTLLESCREQISSSRATLDSCTSPAGKALWEQCRINFHAADSLFSAGRKNKGEQALDLTRMLFEKAMQKCTESNSSK